MGVLLVGDTELRFVNVKEIRHGAERRVSDSFCSCAAFTIAVTLTSKIGNILRYPKMCVCRPFASRKASDLLSVLELDRRFPKQSPSASV